MVRMKHRNYEVDDEDEFVIALLPRWAAASGSPIYLTEARCPVERRFSIAQGK